MERMKTVLLIFEEKNELDFIAANLVEDEFLVAKASNLKEALLETERIIPDLVVINTPDTEFDLQVFIKTIKTQRLQDVTLLSLIELENYFKTTSKEHFVVKSVRPKLLLSLIRNVMNNEAIDWFPSLV